MTTNAKGISCDLYRESGPMGLVRFLLRIVMGGIFLIAAWDKMAHPDRFADIMMHYDILPHHLINLAAIWLAPLELVIGLAVIAGVWVRASAMLMSGLMLVFILGIAWALHRGIDLTCGCFSTAGEEEGRDWLSLWQEILILAGSVLLWVIHWKPARQ
jgi:uncharacterized membrane protein YphA (DoxX/SURF4 family)